MIADLLDKRVEAIPGLDKYKKKNDSKDSKNLEDDPGIERMRRSKPGKSGRPRVIYSNMACPPDYWKIANGIFRDHGSVAGISLIQRAIHEFSEAEWEFLEKASGELARLQRYGDLLPCFVYMVERPGSIAHNFANGKYGNFPGVFYGSENRQAPEEELRYGLSVYIAAGGEIFNIFSRHYDSAPLSRALCAVLFSRPYRKDWQTYPLSEIEDDAFYLKKLFMLNSEDFVLPDWNSDCAALGYGEPKFAYIIKHCRELRYLASGVNGDLPESCPAPRNAIDLSGYPDWFVPKRIPCVAKADVGVLPDNAYALEINKVSGAHAPMYMAIDKYGMHIALFPESQDTWDAMLRIYGMPKRDALYPESATAQLLLSPRSVHFPQEMADAFGLVYLGVQSLGEYIENLPDPDHPGCQFHAFAIKNEK